MPAYCFTVSGIFKVITIILGSVGFGLGAYSYDETIVQEEFFLRTVQIALAISVINLGIWLATSSKLEGSDIALAIDIAFHVTGAVVLPIAAGLIIYSTVDNDRTYCQVIFTVYPHLFCQFYGIKMASGITTLVNGGFYLITAATIFLTGSKWKPKLRSTSNQLRNPIFSIPWDEEGRQGQRSTTFHYGRAKY